MPFLPSKQPDFLGVGIAFPLKLNNGRVVLSSGFDLIRSSLRIILSWNSPKRFFLAEYNSRIRELLEEPNDNFLIQVLEAFTIDAIKKWEKRVELISVEYIKSDSVKLEQKITYKIINTQQIDSFIYPFYKTIIY